MINSHPVADPTIKMEIVMRVVNALLGRGPPPSRRTIALICAAYSANVIENALTAATVLGGMQLTYSQKDACFAKCEEMLVEWSGVQAFEQGMAQSPVGEMAVGAISPIVGKWQAEKQRLGWTDICAGVVGVYLKMDSML